MAVVELHRAQPRFSSLPSDSADLDFTTMISLFFAFANSIAIELTYLVDLVRSYAFITRV